MRFGWLWAVVLWCCGAVLLLCCAVVLWCCDAGGLVSW